MFPTRLTALGQRNGELKTHSVLSPTTTQIAILKSCHWSLAKKYISVSFKHPFEPLFTSALVSPNGTYSIRLLLFQIPTLFSCSCFCDCLSSHDVIHPCPIISASLVYLVPVPTASYAISLYLFQAFQRFSLCLVFLVVKSCS